METSSSQLVVKITSLGLTVAGERFPAYLWHTAEQTTAPGEVRPERISVSLKGYKSLPPGTSEALGLEIRNSTDLMSDHFDNDHLDIRAGHPRFAEAALAFVTKERGVLKRAARRPDAKQDEIAAATAKLDALEARFRPAPKARRSR